MCNYSANTTLRARRVEMMSIVRFFFHRRTLVTIDSGSCWQIMYLWTGRNRQPIGKQGKCLAQMPCVPLQNSLQRPGWGSWAIPCDYWRLPGSTYRKCWGKRNPRAPWLELKSGSSKYHRRSDTARGDASVKQYQTLVVVELAGLKRAAGRLQGVARPPKGAGTRRGWRR